MEGKRVEMVRCGVCGRIPLHLAEMTKDEVLDEFWASLDRYIGL